MTNKTVEKTEQQIRDQWDCYNNGMFGHLEGTIEFVTGLVTQALQEEREKALAGQFFNRVNIQEEVHVPKEIVEHIENRTKKEIVEWVKDFGYSSEALASNDTRRGFDAMKAEIINHLTTT
jgi:hypothetical protein